ncbi:MAG: polysaccharide deacetylase family protein [Anaerolineaceae bacterium]|nr:polysaccharide deacetylase family protein [Anaerolineaceae bacterium]
MDKKFKQMKITRREFLVRAGIGLVGSAAVACQPIITQIKPQIINSQQTQTPFTSTQHPTDIPPSQTPTPPPTHTPTCAPTFSPDQLPDLLSQEEINFLAHHEIKEGDTSRPVVMMTYDDNAKYKQVRFILDAYKKYQMKASFFFIGEKILLSAKAVRAIVEEGHLLGCHGWVHDDFLQLSSDKVNRRIEKSFKAVQEIVPGYRLRFIRFPYGSGTGSMRLLKIAASWGLQHTFWNISSGGLVKNTYDTVMRDVQNGSIVVSHMFRKYDVEQAEDIIISLLEKGYTLETVETGRKPEDIFTNVLPTLT